ncbi:Exonuclease 1 [Linum perenne]
MGIQGLLPLLKSTMLPIHIKDLQGCSVAIDTYSWLHKGALSCSTQLCKGLPTSSHIEYCMHRVNLLRHYGVKPVLVFDGGFLPMKLEQENKRARSRKENLARAIEHESNGNSTAAYECYQKAVDISPSIAHDLIQVLKQENVSYVVAPYEADAQMTFMAVNKHVDAVITEDSDLIAFGCPRIIFKMDKYGQGVEFQYSRLHKNKELCFAGFTNQMVLEMCILSGCDYLQSLPGMGLKRAHALISKFKSYEKVIKHLKYSTVSVPPLYEESFKKALLTFKHQRVYDPTAEDIVHLSDIPESLSCSLTLNTRIPQDVAKGIATGDVDPFTQMPFQECTPSSAAVINGTSKAKNSKPQSIVKKIDLPVQKNLLTNYFCFASIEAKRRFKTPRKSPTSSVTVDSSSLKEFCFVGANSGRISCPSASTSASEKPSSSSPHTTVETLAEPKFLESPSSVEEKATLGDVPLKAYVQSLNQSGQTVLKECETKTNQKHRTHVAEHKKVIVRSRYFQHKPINDESQESKEMPRSNNDDVGVSMTNERARLTNLYFARKSSPDRTAENRQEESPLQGNVDSDREDCSSAEKSPASEVTMKRKTSPIDTEHKRSKYFCTNSSSPVENSGGCSSLEPDEEELTEEEQTEGGKFGANIKHLDRYSEIAENSVDRFATMLSSFRYSSNGSRASGLRAPLKDIKNTCTNRSTIPVPDFSEFAYRGTAASSKRR